MAQTCISATSAYAAISDLTNYRDQRQIADWIATGGVRATLPLTGNTTVQAHLDAAAGLIEAACVKANHYSPLDLAALTGVSLALLIKINCWLAIDSLSMFKTRTKEDQSQIEWAQAVLLELANGTKIFSFQEAANAGEPGTQDMAPPGSLADGYRLTTQAGRLFGGRCKWANGFGGWTDSW